MNKSDAAKDLLERGYLLYQLDDFKAGRISLGRMAENLQVPLAEALGLVSRFNVHPEMPKDLLAEGWVTARRLARP
jgi:predicted HTH domain antitoxin